MMEKVVLNKNSNNDKNNKLNPLHYLHHTRTTHNKNNYHGFLLKANVDKNPLLSIKAQ